MAPRKPVKQLALILCLLAGSPLAVGNNLQQAAKAVRLQDFYKAGTIYRDLAQKGDPEAQYQLGSFYMQGLAFGKNFTQAKKWLGKAADQGMPQAQYSLAMLVQDKEPERAQTLLEQAAAQGYRPAESQLERRALSKSRNFKQKPFAIEWFGAARNNDVKELERLNKQKNSVNLEDEHGRTAIFYSIESNAQKAFDWLKRNRANLNKRDKYGATPLQVAIERNNKAIFNALLIAKAKADTILKNGDSLIHYALRLKQYDYVAPLIKAGALVNHRNVEGWTALDLAEFKGAAKTVSLLKENGAARGLTWQNTKNKQDVKKVSELLKSGDLPPVALAVINNNKDLLTNLVTQDPSLLNTRLKDDSTLLILAAKQHKTDMVDTLIALGSNITEPGYKGYSPLQVATREGQEKAVASLLKAGASPIQKDDKGNDAVMAAIEAGEPELANLLLDNLIDKTRSKSETRVHLRTSGVPVNKYILKASQYSMEPLVERLIPYITDQLEVDQQGRNALWFAAEEGDAKLVFKLLKAGVHPDHEDSIGMTPFIVAAERGCLECARQLLGFVDINHQTKSGNTALLLASRKGDVKVASWLIQNKADIEKRNKRGNTAIMEAVNSGSKEIVQRLIKADANVTRKNKLGFSAIDLATDASPEMLELVKSKSVLGIF